MPTYDVKLRITTNSEFGGNPAKWDWETLICEHPDEKVTELDVTEVKED